MSLSPRLDVVIPVRNGLPWLRQAVDSALAQAGVRVHVFVVDDGSTDGTAEEVSSWHEPRVTLVTGQGSGGAARVRNEGARLGNAEWLAFLDADDLWPHRRTSRLMAAISDPGTQISVGRMLQFRDATMADPTDEHSLSGLPRAPVSGGVLFTRALYEQVGEFDESLRVGEFVDWLARARRQGKQEVPVETVSLLRRSHADNTSRTRQDEYGRDYLRIIMAHRKDARPARRSHTEARPGQAERP